MKLSGVHLLLTYSCNLECEHCFVWGSPRQEGAMTLGSVTEIIRQADDLGTVEWIYFEGGEPFLHYAVLLAGVRCAADLGFRVGIVSNGYWATDIDDGIECLTPFAGLVDDLSISNDPYHGGARISRQADNACAAARKLGISTGTITIAQPETADAPCAVGKLPPGESAVFYRGRAAEVLSPRAGKRVWTEFTTCPCEDLREPGRVHVDPYGDVHVCQGIRVGNVFRAPLETICAEYAPDSHPIVGPLLRGGPAQIVREHEVTHKDRYADACHLCCAARTALRHRMPLALGPDQMYGVGIS